MAIRVPTESKSGPVTKTKRSKNKSKKINKCPPSSSAHTAASTKKSVTVSGCPTPTASANNACSVYISFSFLVNFNAQLISFVKTGTNKIMFLVLHNFLWNLRVEPSMQSSSMKVKKKKKKKQKRVSKSTWFPVIKQWRPSWSGTVCMIKALAAAFALSVALIIKIVFGFVRRFVCQVGQCAVSLLKWPAILLWKSFVGLSRFLWIVVQVAVGIIVCVLKIGLDVIRRAARLFLPFIKIFKRLCQPRFLSWTKSGRTMQSTLSSSPSSSTSSLSPPLNSPVLPRRAAENGEGARRGPPFTRAGIYHPPRASGPVAGVSSFKIMDCHMDWISDMMPMYLSSSEKETYCNTIIQMLQEWMEEIINRVVTPGTGLLIRLMLAGFYAHLSKFTEALEWLNEAVDSLQGLSEENPKHVQALGYLLKVNFYKINRKMKLVEGMSMKLLEEEAVKELKEIKDLFDEKDGPFQAVLHYATGVLAGVMVRQDKNIDSFRMAIQLEPDCSHWHRLLYQALRKKRRENTWPPPSYDEKKAITKAYELDPDFCLNQTFYASMLEEKMKGFRDKNLIIEESKKEIGDEIIWLMGSALEKNPEDRWTHVRLAEIFAYGRFPHLDPKEGEKMFEECEERWPDCSMVLHKFGLYFVVTANNPQKALQYYIRSLECDAGNFPCLMDYLKTSQRLGMDKEHMVEMIDKCLGPVCLHNSGPFVKMMIAKGILLWLIDVNNGDGGTGKQKACMAWIEAAMKDNKSCGLIAAKITSGYWTILGEYSIDVVKLEGMLTVFLAVATSARNHDQERAIKSLIMELRNQESDLPGPRYRTFSTTSSVSNCSFVTARTSVSQADSANNWRDTSPQLPPLVGGTGIFSKYEDPMEVRFRGGFNPLGLNLGLTTVPALKYENPDFGNERYGKTNRKTAPLGEKKPCLADLDNDWRR